MDISLHPLLRGPTHVKTAPLANHQNQWKNHVILDFSPSKPYIQFSIFPWGHECARVQWKILCYTHFILSIFPLISLYQLSKQKSPPWMGRFYCFSWGVWHHESTGLSPQSNTLGGKYEDSMKTACDFDQSKAKYWNHVRHSDKGCIINYHQGGLLISGKALQVQWAL